MNKKLLFIVNPVAGKRLAKEYMLAVINMLDEAGYHVTACCTQNNKNATEIVKNRAGEFDTIVCCGGDGTLKETVSGLNRSGLNIPVGYIPMGTTNDFASTHNIPTDTMNAVKAVIDGKTTFCDVGVFNESDEFIYVAAFGCLSETSYNASAKLKNAIGRGAYYWESVKSIKNIHGINLTVECNDEKISGEFIYGSVSNSFAIAGFDVLRNAEVELDDGLHELSLVRKPKNPAQIVKMLSDIFSGKATESEYIVIRKAAEFRFHFENEEVAWSLDGEYGGKYRDVTTRNIEKGVTLFTKG